MEHVLYFAAGAVFGTAFLLLGMTAGKNTARPDTAKSGAVAAERDAGKETPEQEEERRRQEKEAENLRKQFENMMNYTGEVQE